MVKFFTTLNKYHKNKIGLLRFLIISFIVLNLYISIVPTTKSQTEPPATGDWIISDTTVKSNCDIELDGDLKIENGGSLTLNYVKLKMKDLKSITVESGGSFYVYNSVIEGITKSDFYKFFVYGTMRIENSYVNETWGPDFGYMWKSGIQILSDDVIIYNSTISNAKETAIGIESASPKIINCNIINNAYSGLIALKSSSIVVDGCIIDNPFHNILFSGNCKGTFSNSTTNDLFLQDSCEVNLYKVQMEYVTIQRGVTTTFRDSTITGSIYMNENSHPIFLNTSFYETKIEQFDETCSITVQWNLNIRVESNMTGGVSAALVQVRDNENGNFIKNFTTDNDGWVRGIICTAYIKKLETKEYYTPHLIIAKKGEENGYINVNINSDKTVILTISNLSENYPPSEPTNIFPVSTHNPTPALTWSPSIDLNLDPITYHIDIWEGPSSNDIKIVEDATETDTNYKILNSLSYGGEYYVDIYATDDKGGKSSTVTHVLKIINQKPSAPEIYITPLNPRTTDDLKCSIITRSKDNDIDPMDKVLYAYEWYKDGIL
ncbi:MAG: fibronectin type III domain-containing protein, partial [Thermoplasmata archaeon]|nr:fibronectin type III domain-containing protein [Thermoplasmata archaeon]